MPVVRSVFPIDLLASAARTADITTANAITPPGATGLYIHCDFTAGAAFSVVPTIQVVNPNDDTEFDAFFAFTAITTLGRNGLILSPRFALTPAARHEVAEGVLPPLWNLFMDHADATSVTYQVRAQYL